MAPKYREGPRQPILGPGLPLCSVCPLQGVPADAQAVAQRAGPREAKRGEGREAPAALALGSFGSAL